MTSSPITVRGAVISEDTFGLICLDDIWKLARASESRAPKHWKGTTAAKRLIQELQKKVTTAYLKAGRPNIPVIYAKVGRGNEGTFGHPVLAAAYAGYLSPKLEIEIRETWLRYRAGDATLADEILQNASAEANEWAGMRALGRAARKEYVDALIAHQVSQPGIGSCTNAIYQGLFKTTAKGLRSKLQLKSSQTPRDFFNTADLAYTMAAEMLAKEDIEEGQRSGDAECRTASLEAARAIGQAIEQNREERRRQGKFPT